MHSTTIALPTYLTVGFSHRLPQHTRLPTAWNLPQGQHLAQAQKLADTGYVVPSHNVRGFWQ
ncbi:hypothetical protein [Streptomyces soliscabiei]|uniref:hypothetical protein n=1 Tax=Streptomyces soliscabiei TaxID=588897 RepID=UPI0029B043E0|nr:hypothetical protein [Streptomyces sp. NY05-11A]MDX2675364.1 hypothetical protein [Streptomyces sp. NY05-11A]